MTPEEAKRIIIAASCYDSNAIVVAVEALDKQIAANMKDKYVNTRQTGWQILYGKCPICGEELAVPVDDHQEYRFCGRCGQKISLE